MKTKRLFVTYPGRFFPGADTAIVQAVGQECDGSGMGPEGRDMDFTIKASSAEPICERLEPLKKKFPGLTAEVD